MSEQLLEERVTTLEQQVAELRAVLMNGTRGKDWQSTVGMFTYDEVWKRIDEEGRKWRAGNRHKAKRKHTKAQQTKS